MTEQQAEVLIQTLKAIDGSMLMLAMVIIFAGLMAGRN
jgi:hypothetical protein